MTRGLHRTDTLTAFLLMVALMGFLPAQAQSDVPAQIEVWTVSSIPVTIPPQLAAVITVVELDRALVIEQRLAEGLDRMPEDRRAASAESRLSRQFLQELNDVWTALLRIRKERITHLPVIILDDRAFWMGQDLNRAVTTYRHWLQDGGKS